MADQLAPKASESQRSEKTQAKRPAPAQTDLGPATLSGLAPAILNPSMASPRQILALQRAAGNQAVTRLIAGSAPTPGAAYKPLGIQARLTVGAAKTLRAEAIG